MCVGIPLEVIAVENLVARCREGEVMVSIDLSLVDAVAVGDWLLTFQGTAREVISAERAEMIQGALGALLAAQNGTTDFSVFFPDLNREPALPDFLRLQSDALQKESP